MSRLLVLDRGQTAAALDPRRLLDAVAGALVAVSRGEVSAPPRIAAQTPAGLLGAMPAYVPGVGLAAKLVSVFATPGQPGRSQHRGIVTLFDAADGRPLAIMDAQPITAARTAASATLSMQALARASRRIAVIGAGIQAHAQLAMLAVVEPDTAVIVGARDPDQARAAAATHPNATANTIETAVRAADVVFCCTGAREPVFPRSWLADGAHVSSVGGSHGPELAAETVNAASVFAEWPGAAAASPPAGAHELQQLTPDQVTLLGAVLDGSHPGRRCDAELTVFKSTGHAALDVAAATVVHAWAEANGTGVELDW